jgi:hypothetical protein
MAKYLGAAHEQVLRGGCEQLGCAYQQWHILIYVNGPLGRLLLPLGSTSVGANMRWQKARSVSKLARYEEHH